MKVTLEFDAETERRPMLDAINGSDYKWALQNIREAVRHLDKEGDELNIDKFYEIFKDQTEGLEL